MVRVRRACLTQPMPWKWLCSLGGIAKESQTSCKALTFHNNVKPGKYNTQGNLGWERIFFNIWRSTCSNSGSTESSVSSRTLLHYNMKPCWYCCSEGSPGGGQRQEPEGCSREEVGRVQGSQMCHTVLAWTPGLCFPLDEDQAALVICGDNL